MIVKQYLDKLFHTLSIPKSLFFVLLFFLPAAHGSVEVWSVTVMHTVTIIIVMLWILSMIRKNHLSFYRTPLDLPLVLLLLITAISVSFSVYPYASRIQTYKIINYLLIFGFLINTTRDKEELISLVRTIVVFGGLYAIVALILVEGRLLGFKIFSLEQNWITLTFVNHNHFAGFLDMVILLCLGLVLSYRGVKRILLISLGMCMAVAVLFSLSRGGTIGLAGGLLFFVLIMAIFRSRRKTLLLFLGFPVIVILAITLLGAFHPVLERMSTLQTPTITGESRLRVWNDTLNIIKANLWIGTGIGTFRYAYPRYQTESFAFSYNHAHNSYLELTSEMGVPGILSLVLIIAILFIGGIKKLAAQHDKRLQAVGIGSLAGCLAILLHEVTDFNFYIPSNALLFTVCAAFSIVSAGIDTDKPSSSIHIKLTNRGKYLSCLAVTLVSILFLAATLSPLIGNLYYREAKKQERLRNYKMAYKALKSAMFIDAGNAEHMASMGDLMAKNAAATNNPAEKGKFYSASVTYYDNAIDASPVRGYYYTKKAFSLIRLDKSKEAEEALKKAASLSPMDASNYLNLGTFYLDYGEQNKAYQEYKKALLLDEDHLIMILDAIWEVSPSHDSLSQAVPETHDLRESFANYLLEKGLNDAGKKELYLALSLAPTEEEITASFSRKLGKEYIYRKDIQTAKMYEKAGRYDEAISIYNQLIIKYRNKQRASGFFQQLFNDESSAQLLFIELARLYSNTAQYDKAIPLYRQLIDEGDKPVQTYLFSALAYLYKKTNQYQLAINTWQEGVKQWPDNKQLQQSLKKDMAANYNRLDQYDKAIPLYRQLIDEGDRPVQAYLFSDLAYLYKKTNQYQLAINTWQEGVTQWPDNKQLQQSLKKEMAENYNRLDQYDKAIPLYRQLIDEGDKPVQAYLFSALAYLYKKTNQYQLAINTWQEGVTQWPDNIGFHQQLGIEYRRMKLNQKAIEQWKKCLEIDPGFTPCKQLLEDSLGETG